MTRGPAPAPPAELAGLRMIADRYDGFILDLWGVIHDGVSPYPGAADCLRRLRDAGKPTLLLSNAPRRAHAVEALLAGMDIPRDHYTAILTSGEATHAALRDRDDPWFAALGRRMFHLGPARDLRLVDGLELSVADRPADATFVLNTGPDDEAGPAEPVVFEDTLRACHAAGLPMICANPDLEVIRGGVRVLCAGTLARRYQAMGGVVRAVGKPDPAIYGPALDRLGLPRGRVLAVGDALHTDIAGAHAAGIDSLWVLGGVNTPGLTHAERVAVARAAGLAPVATLSTFVW